MSDFDERHDELVDTHEWDITLDLGDRKIYYVFTGSTYGVEAHMKLLYDDNMDDMYDGTGRVPSIYAYCERCETDVDYVQEADFGRMKLK